MSNCNFTNNHAINGDNVNWLWTVTEFLNKYNQIHDYDYVLILRNGVGTPSNTIVLNKNGITISSQGNVTFDAKGKNLHFEVTGDNVLIEGITFRNFNLTEGNGAVLWSGDKGILKNCNFINNTGNIGGAVCWIGTNGNIIYSTFINNTANAAGGGICFDGANSTLTDSTFINNIAKQYGGAIYWYNSANGILTNCTFTGNTAGNDGGAIYWHVNGVNGTLTDSTFTDNSANRNGGAICWTGANGTLTHSNFINNAAANSAGGVYWASANSNISYSNFINNTAKTHDGGGASLVAPKITLTDSTFIGNTAAAYGGGIYGSCANGTITSSTFINNTARIYGGGIYFSGAATKVIVKNSIFTSNAINGEGNGGGIYWNSGYGTIISTTFTDNTANYGGGAIFWNYAGSMTNCTFNNTKWIKSNGIYARTNLTINGGKGIVDINNQGTLSGISIVVLNNETYYYPPNTNINLTNKNMHKLKT